MMATSSRIPRATWLMLSVTAAFLAVTGDAGAIPGATPGSAPGPAVTVPAAAPDAPALAVVETPTTMSTAPAATPRAAPVPAQPVQATPTRPIHNGAPQAATGETAADAVTITDDGFGNPVETGPAEVRRLGQPEDTTDLAELCESKPWLCDDSYAH